MTLRNLPRVDDFVVEWVYPLFRVARDLNPEALRRPQSKNKVCSDREFVQTVLGDKPKPFGTIVKDAEASLDMSRSTAARYLSRLVEAGLVGQSGGLYWACEKAQ